MNRDEEKGPVKTIHLALFIAAALLLSAL